jgi:uncharacterized protein YbjT (DUF2867 family)
MTETSNPTVLVVGAAGAISGLVVPELVQRGATVRGLVRRPEQAGVVRALGASEVAVGDLRDRTSIDRALAGVDGVFHIGPAFAEDEAEMGVELVAACDRAGVRKFAFSSAIHPSNGLANHTSKQPVERALYESGLRWTILQPTTFLQNLAPAWDHIQRTGVIAEAFSPSAKVARVDYRDVAVVAAIALTEDRLDYGTYELCGAGVLSREDIAAVVTDVLGRDVRATQVDFDEWASAAGPPYDSRQLELLRRVFISYDEHGVGSNALVLRAILERAPRSVRDFVEDLAAGVPVTATAYAAAAATA